MTFLNNVAYFATYRGSCTVPKISGNHNRRQIELQPHCLLNKNPMNCSVYNTFWRWFRGYFENCGENSIFISHKKIVYQCWFILCPTIYFRGRRVKYWRNMSIWVMFAKKNQLRLDHCLTNILIIINNKIDCSSRFGKTNWAKLN